MDWFRIVGLVIAPLLTWIAIIMIVYVLFYW
jgi:hypothetical protein